VNWLKESRLRVGVSGSSYSGLTLTLEINTLIYHEFRKKIEKLGFSILVSLERLNLPELELTLNFAERLRWIRLTTKLRNPVTWFEHTEFK
jgi:hypothetical protein